jgi:hypothetical protein
VTREAEVVVGAEHEDALAVDLGFGTVVIVQCLEERVDAQGSGAFEYGEPAVFEKMSRWSRVP